MGDVNTTPILIVEPDRERGSEVARILENAGCPVTIAVDLSSAYLEALGGEESRSTGRRGRPTLAELSRRYAHEILRQVGGNKTRAAEILGIDRKTLYRLIGPPRASKSAPAEPRLTPAGEPSALNPIV
jgi:DNA-binding NtrC family response regulator